MPYKDLERKKEWERLHRPQRLACRRELRRIAKAQGAVRPKCVRHTGAEANQPPTVYRPSRHDISLSFARFRFQTRFRSPHD